MFDKWLYLQKKALDDNGVLAVVASHKDKLLGDCHNNSQDADWNLLSHHKFQYQTKITYYFFSQVYSNLSYVIWGTGNDVETFGQETDVQKSIVQEYGLPREGTVLK